VVVDAAVAAAVAAEIEHRMRPNLNSRHKKKFFKMQDFQGVDL